MVSSRVECPACGTVYAIPKEHGGGIVRCGRCHRRFLLQGFVPVTDDEIVQWITRKDEDNIESDAHRTETVLTEEHEQGEQEESVAIGPAGAGGDIRLVKLSHSGALFEFPARRLEDTAFRCSIPRRCLQCGARSHLRAHVIIYTSHLADSVSLEDEHAAGRLELSEQDVRNCTCEQVLQRLPKVPNVPHPADMPMPYWTCDMCSGTGTISGQIRVNTTTGAGSCRLLIRNWRRAEEFLAASGGKDSPAHKLLQAKIEETAENPWDVLPEAVQHRLEQWFRPEEGERFMAYVPDRDHSRSEDGMAGLTISTKRLIYHSEMRHREMRSDQTLELELAMGKDRGRVRLRTPDWQLKNFTVDRDGLAKLRRALSLAKFHATWK